MRKHVRCDEEQIASSRSPTASVDHEIPVLGDMKTREVKKITENRAQIKRACENHQSIQLCKIWGAQDEREGQSTPQRVSRLFSQVEKCKENDKFLPTRLTLCCVGSISQLCRHVPAQAALLPRQARIALSQSFEARRLRPLVSIMSVSSSRSSALITMPSFVWALLQRRPEK